MELLYRVLLIRKALSFVARFIPLFADSQTLPQNSANARKLGGEITARLLGAIISGMNKITTN
ncbi:hypothetical protein DZB85_26330 [Bacillus sp. LB(2018)]|nr:hypothetical protein DZB88_30460 [Bacillus sp. OE]RFB20347.1 hypothetical protein DZB85_26330 [Bacillus sp. LB(2018)]RFB50745.1 hypothetical protein DZB83_05365 [Bacillus sp. dmp10]RFB77729.1 hypothetical protein DZB94_05295 [Bacillus sp. AW]